MPRCTSLARIVCSGEALPADAQQQVFAKLPKAGLYNLYGPTEAAIDVTHWTCREEGRDSVPIGEPIANLACYILMPSCNRCRWACWASCTWPAQAWRAVTTAAQG